MFSDVQLCYASLRGQAWRGALDHRIRQLSADVLAERLRNLPANIYFNSALIVKSAVVVVSASTMLSILRSTLTDEDTLIRIVFWVLSAMLAGVTQVTWNRGQLITTSRLNILDFFAPIWVGVFEVLLFMACDPSIASVLLWVGVFPQAWLCVAAVHSIACAVLVWNRALQANTHDFDESLRTVSIDRRGRSLAQLCRRWVIADCIFTMLLTTVLGVEFYLASYGAWEICQYKYFTVSIAFCTIVPVAIAVSLNTARQIKVIEHAVIIIPS